MSSYFADNGFNVTLLDTSPVVIDIARQIYATNGHAAEFVVGDAFATALPADRFSLTVSIGLLEHFDDVAGLMREQLRVLKPGGVMLAYVVPERQDNVQRHFHWLNGILKSVADLFGAKNKARVEKEPLYRNGLTADAYVAELGRQGVTETETYGMYPLPMISHSPSFPFSLLPAPLELLLVGIFSGTLLVRRAIFGRDPWRCREEVGQAFLVMARKPVQDAGA